MGCTMVNVYPWRTATTSAFLLLIFSACGQAWAQGGEPQPKPPEMPAQPPDDATKEGAGTDPGPRCQEGMAVTKKTAGRCCWPGQAWSEKSNRCDGPPSCPEGWVGSGSGCIKSGDVPALAPGIRPPTTPPSSAAPPQPAPRLATESQPAARPSAAPAPVPAQAPKGGIMKRNKVLGAGIITFAVGYGIALLAGIIVPLAVPENEQNCESCIVYNVIPVVGPWISLGLWPQHIRVDYTGAVEGSSDCDTGTTPFVIAGEAIDGLAQLTGVALIVAGLAIDRSLRSPATSRADRPNFLVLPQVSAGRVGLNLTLWGF